MDKIKQPTIEQVRAAYQNATGNPELQQLLTDLYGDAVKIDNRTVFERIKTFDDCVAALGNDHALVEQYMGISTLGLDDTGNDIIAYLKLRIMVAALNEGWKPEFVQNERRWYPWFCNITNERYNEMDEDERAKVCRVVGRAYHNAYAYGGLVYANANFASSNSYTHVSSRLAFRTEELADYAGKQFIELYRDFIFAE